MLQGPKASMMVERSVVERFRGIARWWAKHVKVLTSASAERRQAPRRAVCSSRHISPPTFRILSLALCVTSSRCFVVYLTLHRLYGPGCRRPSRVRSHLGTWLDVFLTRATRTVDIEFLQPPSHRYIISILRRMDTSTDSSDQGRYRSQPIPDPGGMNSDARI